MAKGHGDDGWQRTMATMDGKGSWRGWMAKGHGKEVGEEVGEGCNRSGIEKDS